MKARFWLLGGLTGAVLGCGSLLGIDKDYVEGPADSGRDGTGTDDADHDGSTDTDGGADARADGDAGSDAGCAGHICNGVCLDGTSCDGCATGTLLCSATRTCVSACTTCTAATTECWSCAGAQPAGSCEPTATAYCFGAGYTHCPCTDAGASTCPGATQTCRSNVCKTCGEPDTDGYRCKGASECISSSKVCVN